MNGTKLSLSHDLLIKEILDINVPKTEREWAAKREIEWLTQTLFSRERDLEARNILIDDLYQQVEVLRTMIDTLGTKVEKVSSVLPKRG